MTDIPALIPHLTVSPAKDAIEFYKKAFGFEEISRMPTPDGKIMHCAMRMGNYHIMLADAFETGVGVTPQKLGGSPVVLHINVANVDSAFAQAVKVGATVTIPLADMFWGARYGAITDPFGHRWSMSQHTQNVPPAELEKRGEAAFEEFAKK